MKIITRKTYLIFWSIALVLFLPYIFDIDLDSTLDINIHDTYFVIQHFYIGLFYLIFFGISGLIYWLLEILKRKRIDWLTITHSLITVISIIIFSSSKYIFGERMAEFKGQPIYFDYMQISEVINFGTLILLIFGQLFFAINILIGILSKRKS